MGTLNTVDIYGLWDSKRVLNYLKIFKLRNVSTFPIYHSEFAGILNGRLESPHQNSVSIELPIVDIFTMKKLI